PSPTGRTRIPLPRLPQVGEARLEVASGLHAEEMPAGAVRTGDELALAQRVVGDHLAVEADRAERARIGAERGANLVLGRRAEVGAERGQHLHLLEPVVAAQQTE